MATQRQLEMTALEFIFDNDRGLEGGAPVGGLYELLGDDPTLRAVRALRNRGHLEDTEGSLAGDLHITSEGRAVIEQLRQRRGDKLFRLRQAQEQVLAWVANQTDVGGPLTGLASFDAELDLVPFTDGEVADAARKLSEAGYIDTMEIWGPRPLAKITTAGLECLEDGGVAAARDRARQTPPPSQTWNLTGVNSVANATAPGATANAHLTVNVELAKLLAEVIRLADVPLDDEATEALRVIEDVDPADPPPDPTKVEKAVRHLYGAAGKVTTGTVGSIVTLLAQRALGLDS